ncbi:hypothetical protein Tco_1448317 [Tanacetum coccineum]
MGGGESRIWGMKKAARKRARGSCAVKTQATGERGRSEMGEWKRERGMKEVEGRRENIEVGRARPGHGGGVKGEDGGGGSEGIKKRGGGRRRGHGERDTKRRVVTKGGMGGRRRGMWAVSRGVSRRGGGGRMVDRCIGEKSRAVTGIKNRKGKKEGKKQRKTCLIATVAGISVAKVSLSKPS